MKIQINNLCKKYGKKVIFDNFSASVDFDGILMVKGKSGLGKTTLIKMLAGLEKPNSGEISVPAERISFMFQEDRLIPFVSVLKNLTAVCDEEKALKYLSLMELEQEKDASPLSLSGGMRRRVALARALCYDSELIILDEPFKGLDEALKIKIGEILKKESNARPIIIVSHETDGADFCGAETLDLDKLFICQ